MINKKLLYSVLAVVLFIVGLGLFVFINRPATPLAPETEMKYCEADSDCIPVACGCSCSGCGGFDYDDIINRKYVDAWYNQQGCKPPEICPMVCCPRRTVACENNVCIVKEGFASPA